MAESTPAGGRFPHAQQQLTCRVGGCKEALAYLILNAKTKGTIGAFCKEHGETNKNKMPEGYALEAIPDPGQSIPVTGAKVPPTRPLIMKPKPEEVRPAEIMAPPNAVFDDEDNSSEYSYESKEPAQENPIYQQARVNERKSRTMSQETALLPVTPAALAVREVTHQLTVAEVKAQVQLIQEVMQAVMQEGFHYGVIPGTDKPTLLKPGAEKLGFTFRLVPELSVQLHDLGNGHREYEVLCTLKHRLTQETWGQGVGTCSTLESKYRYRNADRTCPYCGRSTIIKGKAEYGGGWLCFQRKGGCGAKFADQDTSIVSQATGRVENPDIADLYNTVLKMSKKRAFIDAMLTATAASDIFTQDLEDGIPEQSDERAPAPQSRPAASAPTARPAQAQSATGNGNDRLITKGQYEIILLSQRRSKVPDAEFKLHLAQTYRIDQLKDLKQKDVNGVLEWLEAEHERRVSASEPQAGA